MSYLDPIASPEADIRRRLQSVPKEPLETRVSNLETAVGDHEFRLGGHDSRLDGHDNLLALYGTRISTAEAAIVSLDDRLTTAEGTLDGHGTVLGDHETRIDDLEAIGGLGGLDTRLTAAEGTIVDHETRLDAAEPAIADHETRIDSLEASKIAIVTTEAELLAAKAANKPFLIGALITLTSTFVADVDGMRVEAMNRECGLLLPHNGSTPVTIARIAAKNVAFGKMVITSGHPLTTGGSIWDIGIDLSTATGVDISGFRITDVEFKELGCPIHRANVSTAEVCRGANIFGNNIHSITGTAIFCQRNMADCEVGFNRIRPKDVGDTHTATGNGIWWGNNGDLTKFHHNNISFYGRHGIEYWNSQTDPTTVGGNFCGQIINNSITNGLFTPYDSGSIGNASFAISAFGFGCTQIHNNVVVGASIGIETYSDGVNTASAHCVGNFVDDIRGQAFSINNLNGGLFEGNIIGRVDAQLGDGSACYGFQIINGGQNITIRGNRLKNSGNNCIRLNGARLTVTGITQAADGVITVSGAIPSKWYVGKVVCLRDVAGMTEINDRYLTIAWISGNQFRCGLDTSGFGAYSSGGIVQERYRNIVIEDNEFHIDEVINAASFSPTIWVYDLQHAVIRGNTRFFKAGLSGVAGFYCSHKGIVYIDDSGTPTTVNSGDVSFTGSNLSVQMFT